MAGEVVEFTPELLAPCGMNCTLCSAYLAGVVTREPTRPK